jgi:hypothetical protein
MGAAQLFRLLERWLSLDISKWALSRGEPRAPGK